MISRPNKPYINKFIPIDSYVHISNLNLCIMLNKQVTGLPNDIYSGQYAIMAYQANKYDICGTISWQIQYQDSNEAVLHGTTGKDENRRERRLVLAFRVPYVKFEYVKYKLYLTFNHNYPFYYTNHPKYNYRLSLISGIELPGLPESELLIRYILLAHIRPTTNKIIKIVVL